VRKLVSLTGQFASVDVDPDRRREPAAVPPAGLLPPRPAQPGPVSRASVNGPPRPARSHAAARATPGKGALPDDVPVMTFPSRSRAARRRPGRGTGCPGPPRRRRTPAATRPPPAALRRQQAQDVGDQLPPPGCRLVHHLAPGRGHRHQHRAAVGARPVPPYQALAHQSVAHPPRVDGATPSASATSTRRCGPRGN
jgi:hypothetical protein